MKEERTDSTGFNAWNPGLCSRIPASLEPLVTLYRPGNSLVDYEHAKELSDFSGLSTDQIIVFTVERLVVHELLVRVTSDLSVPDGPNYEDLGINLRKMVGQIYQGLVPEFEQIKRIYTNEVDIARTTIAQQLNEHLFASADAESSELRKPKDSLLKRLFGIKSHSIKKRQSANRSSSAFDEPRELKALSQWRALLKIELDPSKQHCFRALIKTINSIFSKRGTLVNELELLTTIATNYASNHIGDALVCKFVGERFEALAKREGYKLLPLQEKSVVMNVKGASASGKSTIRPQQRQLADKLGVAWEDFALISPDYWRKYLLDYHSLGENYKYAAMLTGQELAIIDKKLDRYIAEKANKGDIPHLLIDRFRFDSFSVEDGRSQDSKLLSRFGDRLYLFFMITAPEETVARAWERGITTGRYKAVDDLLYHNIEAYTGMPALFFSWVLSNDKRIHFEFLNNNVPKGELPRTIAFGENKSMTILDLNAICSIDRYRQVNIEARAPEDVLLNGSDIGHAFLTRCIDEIDSVKFADASSGTVYAKFEQGKLVWRSKEIPGNAGEKLANLIKRFQSDVTQIVNVGRDELQASKKYTLGSWGENTSA